MIEKYLIEHTRPYIGEAGIDAIEIVQTVENPVVYNVHFKNQDFVHTEKIDIMDIMKGSEINEALTKALLRRQFYEYAIAIQMRGV